METESQQDKGLHIMRKLEVKWIPFHGIS
jgi:hypothetical protein